MKATVLVPTHDHGPTLLYAVRSALRQTITDIEIFVVGDGVPAQARPFVEELVEEDPRVRFIENDKGPRHGEIHRARAIEEATGEIVCYLADDDLWMPDHLESMAELLEHADFANCLPLRVEPDGTMAGWAVNLGETADRQLLLGGENRIPLSASGHTLAAYRRLPHGWRTTPDDLPTDLYMFQQFLEAGWVRAVSGDRATCLHFPSPDRIGWGSQHRCAELERWSERIGDENWRRNEFPLRVVRVQAAGWASLDRDARVLRQERNDLESHLRHATEQLEAHTLLIDRLRDEVVFLRSELEDAAARSTADASRQADLERSQAENWRRLDEAHRELEWMNGSLTWRLRGRALSMPVVGPLLRWAAGVRARRGGR